MRTFFFLTPGRPVENMYMESLNGGLREECLSLHYFTGLDHVRRVVEDWRIDYSSEKLHSSLDDLTPKEFMQTLKETTPTVMAVENMSINAGYANSQWYNERGKVKNSSSNT